ncbi:hypothetical protein BDZ97DRAFT_1766789 [Flammula alnicola]|nr:hypothetical protein BDZ97DRAFT_1766789 [Flammula alnicola]
MAPSSKSHPSAKTQPRNAEKSQSSTKENSGHQTSSRSTGSNSGAMTAKRLENTTNAQREHGQRERKASAKVQHQIAAEEEAAERKQAEAAKRAAKAQRNAPDTEDEEGQSPDEGSEEEEDATFTSHPVTSKPAEIKKRALMRSEGRVPVPRAMDEDQDEDHRYSVEREFSPTAPSQPSPTHKDTSGHEEPSDHKRQPSSLEDLRDTQVPRNNNSRPKTADYDEITKECIIEAIREYRCLISTRFPFPDHPDETRMACESWDAACKELEVDLMITSRITKVITNRGSHTRGELKTKARPIVETFYRFESGQNRKIIAKNRDLAEALKDQYGGLYKNPLIQKIINAMWFHNRQDEGVIFDGYFRPIRPETIALVLTVIDCCIDEWITGIRTDVAFTGAIYHDVFIEHLKCLKDFDDCAKAKKLDILGNIQEKLYNRGRFHAGAQPISKVGVRALPTSAFDAAIKEYEENNSYIVYMVLRYYKAIEATLKACNATQTT